MGDAGGKGNLLPRWEALYCTSADGRAYPATISNHRSSGRYPIHFRDESTGRPVLWQSYPNLHITNGWAGTPVLPAPTGAAPAGYAITHQPSLGYLAYLVSGRWPALESLQFQGIFNLLSTNPPTRRGGAVVACINSPMTTRGAAWAWRSIGQSAALSPTRGAGADTAVQASIAACLANTATWMKQRYVDGSIDGGIHRNSVGWLGQYDGYNGAGSEFWGGGWMVNYQTMALGHISDLGIEGLGAQSALEAVRDHSYDHILSMLGTDASWNFRRAGVYARPYLKNNDPSNPVFMTTSEAFASYRSFQALGPLSASSGDTLKAHSSESDAASGTSSDTGTGYWSQALSSLAMAVEHGKAGAAAKRALVLAAPNYRPEASANDDPTFAIVPRTA